MGRMPDGWVFIPVLKNRREIEIKQMELVTCRHCRHRDPEDGKCDCGGMPWDTQVFPVPDDWFCPNGEE